MGNENYTNKAPNRIAVLITYVIAFLCMAVGLFLPMGPAQGLSAIGGKEAMLGLQLLAAVDAALPSLNLTLGNALGVPFTYVSVPLTFGGFTVDAGAIIALLYGIIFVAGLVALVPVIINSVSKKSTKNTALAAASFIEVLASVTLLALVIFRLNYVLTSGDGIGGFNCLALIVAFGGTLLMLIVQALIYKKGSGFAKLVFVLLSAIALIVCVFDVTAIIPALAEPLKGIPAAIGFGSLGLYGDVTAISLINGLCAGTLSFEVDAAKLVLMIGALAAGILAIVNLVIDVMGLGKRTNKFMLICNVVRYGLELIAVILVIVMTLVIKETLGLYAVILAVLAVIALVIDIIRLAVYGKKKKAAKATPAAYDAETATQPVAEKKETKKERKEREKAEREAAKQAAAEEKAAQAAAAAEAKQAEKAEKAERKAAEKAAPATEEAVAAEEPVANLYTPLIYDGPTDDFINTLSNEQRIEFARMFIEHQHGKLAGVPDYVVSGQNEKFFSSVFIYMARIREHISDGLMNALYKQANMMR